VGARNEPTAATLISDLSAGRCVFIISANAGVSGERLIPIATARNFKRLFAVERNGPAPAKADGKFQPVTLESL
jgi:hypothetical protein